MMTPIEKVNALIDAATTGHQRYETLMTAEGEGYASTTVTFPGLFPYDRVIIDAYAMEDGTAVVDVAGDYRTYRIMTDDVDATAGEVIETVTAVSGDEVTGTTVRFLEYAERVLDAHRREGASDEHVTDLVITDHTTGTITVIVRDEDAGDPVEVTVIARGGVIDESATVVATGEKIAVRQFR